MHLSACSEGHQPPARVNNELEQSPATLNSDALQAPVQPELVVRATPETLRLSWQFTGSEGRSSQQWANLYAYNTMLREEILIQGNIDVTTSSFSMQSRTPRRAWHNEQFRFELCDVSDCVSSARVPLNSLAAETTTVLRPGVFINGERFAEYIAANDDASIVFVTRPVQNAVQVFFHNQRQWVATPPVSLGNAISNVLKAIDSSASGDTLAALLASDETPSTIRIIERLGETWLPTATLPVPASITVDKTSNITLSTDGEVLLLHSEENVLIYRRNNLEWVMQTPVELDSGAKLKAATVNGQFNTIHLLIQTNGQLWLESYQSNGDDHRQTDNQARETDSALSNPTLQLPEWQNVRRSLVQGVDALDDIQLQTDSDATSIIVAGWDNANSEQRSPVMWRMRIAGNVARPESGEFQTLDSLRAAPTNDTRARLRFSASNDLNTVVLGWQSPFGDAAEISTYIYRTDDRQWHSALELPHELTRLAKQAFAHSVLFSADGETLLVTTPAGNASLPTNRVGELRVFR